MKDAAPIEERIGHRFADKSLLSESLTHRPPGSTLPPARSPQPMEFRADAVL